MWEQIRSNQKKTAVLIVLMALFLFLIGYALGELLAPGFGPAGLVIAFVVWFVMTLVSYFSGDKVFLTLSGARKIDSKDHKVLYDVVEEMKLASGLSRMPDIYIIDDASPNAFATGRSPETAAVAVTSGLLEKLNRNELQGVIAHEIGHIKNRDILYMMMIGVMMGVIVLLADIGVRQLFWGGSRRRTSSSEGNGSAQLIIMAIAIVLIILAPMIAQMIYFAVSRKREYLADASGAQYTRYPEGLASALEKISTASIPLKSATRASAPMYIINPLGFGKKKLSDLSATHPPTSERIKILRSMAGGAGFKDYDHAFQQVTGRPVGVIPFQSLQKADAVKSVTPPADPLAPLHRVRAATDMLWKLNKYIFIACACGTKLKVPQAYVGKKIECPHCMKSHEVKKQKIAAA